MISTMRPDIDNVDEYVRNTTARAFAVVASALGIPSLLPFLKVRFILPILLLFLRFHVSTLHPIGRVQIEKVVASETHGNQDSAADFHSHGLRHFAAFAFSGGDN